MYLYSGVLRRSVALAHRRAGVVPPIPPSAGERIPRRPRLESERAGPPHTITPSAIREIRSILGSKARPQTDYPMPLVLPKLELCKNCGADPRAHEGVRRTCRRSLHLVPHKLLQHHIALILHLLMNADFRRVISVRGGVLQLAKEDLFRSLGVHFVLRHARQHCDTLLRASFHKRAIVHLPG